MSETPVRRIFLIAGEESGDQLGAKLMRALRERLGTMAVRFEGVGGHRMAEEGLESLFPLHDIAVMGISAVIPRLPALLKRIRRTADAVLQAKPDVLVIIDSPDFTHRVARRVRRRDASIPIVDYVSPTVWAWRPGRARAMSAYVDHLLALLPFEPEAHERLSGPPTTYVGHPLIERLRDLRPGVAERPPLGEGPIRLLVLPGSRRSEISRLMAPFGEALSVLSRSTKVPFEVVVPAVDRLYDEIAERAKAWPVAARLVRGEAAKWAAFRSAHVALAASGTVTLELALAGVPMVVAYRVSRLEEQLKYIIRVPSIVLANLVLGENVIPELIQWDCTPEKLASALVLLMGDTLERRRQEEAFARLDDLMAVGDDTPSGRAARIVEAVMERRPVR
jgi:lipid-A-disaccharide synthase